MSNALLRLSYALDDETCGELTASVVSGAFSGKGRAWFDREMIKTSFLAALRAFPNISSSSPKIEGGIFNREHVLEHCFLRIEVVTSDGRGTPVVKIDLMAELGGTSLPPERWIFQKVEARFLTDYASIDRFADDFEKVLDGRLQEAALEGEAIG